MASDRQQMRAAIFIPVLSGHRSTPSDIAKSQKTPTGDNLIRGILKKKLIEVAETSHEVNVSQTPPDSE